jgi:hypothetical protein
MRELASKLPQMGIKVGSTLYPLIKNQSLVEKKIKSRFDRSRSIFQSRSFLRFEMLETATVSAAEQERHLQNDPADCD